MAGRMFKGKKTFSFFFFFLFFWGLLIFLLSFFFFFCLPLLKTKKKMGKKKRWAEMRENQNGLQFLMGEKNRKYRQISPAEWSEIKILKDEGVSVKSLATRFKRSESTIRNGLKKIESEGSATDKQLESAIKQDFQNISELAAEKLQKNIEETKENNYKWSRAIALCTMGIINKGMKADNFEAYSGDLVALKTAAATLKITKDLSWSVLGLDKQQITEDDVPSLVVRVMTDQEVADAQKGIELEDGMEDELAIIEEEMEGSKDPGDNVEDNEIVDA